MLALAAATPLALLLGLMLGLGWAAWRAGAAALLLALGLLLAGLPGLPAWSPSLLLGVLAEALFLALGILWILWPALALHELQQRSGALDTLRQALPRLCPEPAVRALLLAWFLALFFEGAAGFGTPVALVAPLLVGLGVAPLQAVLLALLGHAAGVGFGALGTPVLAQAALVGAVPAELAGPLALLMLPAGLLLMLALLRELHRSGLPWPGWRAPALAWLSFAGPTLLLAWQLGPELATLGAALLGAGLFLGLRWQGGQRGPGGQGDSAALSRALLPYGLLVLLVLAQRLGPGSQLPALTWQWQGFEGRLAWASHPGTLLMAALLLSALLRGHRMVESVEALGQAARRLGPVALALCLMLALARLMLHGGLLAPLQQAAVQHLGVAWAWVAPALGALGSLVTGSATASNLLFSPLQAQAAQALQLPLAWVLAAQTAGAALGNLVCPHNLVAGAAAVGLAGREGELLRRTAGPCLLGLLLLGLGMALIGRN